MLAIMLFEKWRRVLTIIFPEMLAIIISRTVSNYNLLNSWKMISEMLAIIISRTVGNYNVQEYWQIWLSEILAIIFVGMLAANVSN